MNPFPAVSARSCSASSPAHSRVRGDGALPLTRLLLTAFALTGFAGSLQAADAVPAQRPNILVIVADDLDTHELSCYGGRNLVTPNIDRLATEGMLFTHMFSPQAMCVPTRAALYTGLHPFRNGSVRNHMRSNDGVRSIVHHLTALGYRVGIAGKVHVIPRQTYPFEYVGGFPKGSMRNAEDETYDTTSARAFMLREPTQPFCLFICSALPHAPYLVGDASQFDADNLILPPHCVDTPKLRAEFRQYVAEIDALDQQVGDVLNLLDESKLVDSTLTVFSGEQGSAFPGAKWTCYSAGLRSGFIVRLPGTVKAGTRTDAIAMCEDLVPTLIELSGGSVADKKLDGRSLVGVLTGATQKHRDCAFGMCNMLPDGKPYASRTIVNHDYRLILNLTSADEYTSPVVQPLGGVWRTWLQASQTDAHARSLVDRLVRRPAVQMFDLRNDPWELENVADHPDVQSARQELEALLASWMKAQGDPGAGIEAMTREEMYRLWPGMRVKDAEKAQASQETLER